jgi:hypothetical protein
MKSLLDPSWPGHFRSAVNLASNPDAVARDITGGFRMQHTGCIADSSKSAQMIPIAEGTQTSESKLMHANNELEAMAIRVI